MLQNTVGGGKPKMKYHFNNNGWPASILGPAPDTDEARNRLVDQLQVRGHRGAWGACIPCT